MTEDDLSTKPCPACSETSEEVLNMETRKRVGWYCPACKHFEKAILREIPIYKIEKVHI